MRRCWHSQSKPSQRTVKKGPSLWILQCNTHVPAAQTVTDERLGRKKKSIYIYRDIEIYIYKQATPRPCPAAGQPPQLPAASGRHPNTHVSFADKLTNWQDSLAPPLPPPTPGTKTTKPNKMTAVSITPRLLCQGKTASQSAMRRHHRPLVLHAPCCGWSGHRVPSAPAPSAHPHSKENAGAAKQEKSQPQDIHSQPFPEKENRDWGRRGREHCSVNFLGVDTEL